MADLELLTFADATAFSRWLEANGEASPGVLLRLAKRGAPETTISKTEAIDCALAYGWIDGQLGGLGRTLLQDPIHAPAAWERLVAAKPRAGREARERRSDATAW